MAEGNGTLLPPGLSSIAAGFDLVLCDIWGVIHNGVAVFAPAIDALQRFRLAGGRVILVSNAPRPHGSVAIQLEALGVPADAHDAIVTSGDITRGLILQRQGQPLFHVGPSRDLPLFSGLDAALVPLAEARYVVCTGLVNDETETAADYSRLLEEIVRRGLSMVCANPDLSVDRGGLSIPCAGALGAACEALGGTVTYPGKPFAPIYAEALAMSARMAGVAPPLERVLAIGDSLRTDIAGAYAFGIASLMVLEGIHAVETGGLNPYALRHWLAAQAHVPGFAMPVLCW